MRRVSFLASWVGAYGRTAARAQEWRREGCLGHWLTFSLMTRGFAGDMLRFWEEGPLCSATFVLGVCPFVPSTAS
jgi:hypothetical protein